MSRSGEIAYEKEQDESENRSVFDFLYYDSRRIGSYLGQIFDAGLLEKLTEKESATKIRQRGFKLSVGGGASVVGTGGNATLGIEKSPGEQGSEETQRVYDPLWTNARTFLDYLNNNELISSNLKSAQIGRFVYFKGDMTVVDLGIIGKTWNKPSFQRMMALGNATTTPGFSGSRTERRRQQAQASPARQPELSAEAQLLVDLLDILPHTAQAYFSGGDDMVWCGLREEALVVKPGDLLLKHGFAVEGEWAVLGILDAKPSTGAETTAEQRMAALGFDINGGQGVAASLMLMIAPVARNMLGRPPGAFGLTPLLIFREVTG